VVKVSGHICESVVYDIATQEIPFWIGVIAVFDWHLGGLSRQLASCNSVKVVNLSPLLCIAM